MNTKRFIRHLENEGDEVWDRYNRIIERVRATNTNDMLKQIERMHSTRGSRRLMLKTSITADNLIKVHLEEMSYRSALVEINIQASRLYRRLDVALGAVSSHIASNYSGYLRETAVRTKGEITTFIDTLLEDGWSLHGRLEYVMDVGKQVISDIDQAAWGMKNLVELLKVAAARESVIKSTEI